MRADLPDYYEILQVSRRAHPMIVTRAFRLLAAFYHPDNRESGNEEIFRDVLEAHRVLSDPVRRAAYDRAKFASSLDRPAAREVAEALGREPTDERQLRLLIMEALYHVRRSRPYHPVLPVVALAELFGRSVEEIQFSLWYLRGKKWIEMPDGSDVAITVAGVDEVEAHGIEGERPATAPPVMALPAAPNRLADPEPDRGDGPADVVLTASSDHA